MFKNQLKFIILLLVLLYPALNTSAQFDHQPPSQQDNPFVSGPPELQDCLKGALGEKVFQEIRNYKRQPTPAEEKLIGDCMQKVMVLKPDPGELPPGGDHHTERRFSDDASGRPYGFNYNETGQEEDQFIVANPLDLSEISAFSPFRSCMGHDESGYNMDGVEEKYRSMKHYIILKQDVKNAKVMAPFDGIITEILDDGQRGVQVWITPHVNPHWRFVFYHITLESPLDTGSKVKAGQLIGYADVVESMNFDFGLRKFYHYKGPSIYETPFYHMSEAVLDDYAKYGVTKNNMVISKTYRDANPCVFEPGSGNDEVVYLGN